MAKKEVVPSIPTQKVVPVFEYVSDCCSAPAVKAPCSGPKFPKEFNGLESQPSLGTFRCTRCGIKAKVRRKGLTQE